MKKRMVRAVTVILLLAMAVSLASCGRKTNKKIRKIEEGSPWFNAKIIDVDTGADKGRALGSGYHTQFIGMDDQYYIIETRGDYQRPTEDEIDKETFDYNSYSFTYIAVVDRSTNKTVNTIDVRKDLTVSEYFVDSVYYKEGKITVKTELKERDYDALSGELLDTRPRKLSSDDSFSRQYFIGGFEIETVVYQTATYRRYSSINVKTPDGKVNETELKRADKDFYIDYVLALSDTKALILVSEGNNKVYYELDLETNILTAADAKEYKWLDEVSFFSCFTSPDGMLYYMSEKGIFRVNAKTKKSEELFNYNQCGLNRGLIDRFDLVECSEDRFLLCGLYDITAAYEGRTADKFNLIEITRADKNPHIGKTVLEIYSSFGIDEYIGDAVSRFNETNDKFYIEYTDRYRDSITFDDSFDEKNDDVEILARINNSAALSNKLAIDIMNGDGPDILLDCSKFSTLNNSNCLADLTPFVKDADPDKYFTNIIEGSKTDGAIYQLPISFRIEGILTKTRNAGSSGKGFTLDEYKKFSDEVMNGHDPLYFGQSVYFSMLFNSMKEDFIGNKKVDLSKPEFKVIADYVKDNVHEKGISVNDWYQAATGINWELDGEYTDYCTGIGGLLMDTMTIAAYGKGVTLLGIPSIDGRGPRFIPDRSVAISSQAVDIKACGEFVKLLLADDFQTKIAMTDSFVINRTAFKKAGSAAIEYYNNGGSSFLGGNGGGSGIGMKISTKDIDFIENIILSCSNILSEDSDISIILIEEMPAYFTGQKDLDAVIKIAENRIQKVLDERG